MTPQTVTITETYKRVGDKWIMESSLNPGIWLEALIWVPNEDLRWIKQDFLVTKQEFALLQAAQEEQNLNQINKQA